MIYLDCNATTPIDPEVVKAMMPFITDSFGNPSSTHEYGVKAKTALDAARADVAALIGANPEEILFTSGGSEANNTVLKGVAQTFEAKGKHIIISQIEHPAIQEPCNYLEKTGFRITRIPVDSDGIVSAQDVQKAFTDETILVSVMHANNETGAIQPIAEIGALCRQRGILFHTDASQSLGKIPVNVRDMNVDFLTMAGHKLYAPKGIGALYIRSGLNIEPLIHGAGQESGRRAGTENIVFDVALGKACELARDLADMPRIRMLTDKLHAGIGRIFGERIKLNGHPTLRLPNTLFISFFGYTPGELREALGDTAVSTGSACHSHSSVLSPVLQAMGTATDRPFSAIRFSLGRFTTELEVDTVLERLASMPH